MFKIIVDQPGVAALWELAEFGSVSEAHAWGRRARVVYPLAEGFRVTLEGASLAGPIPID